ncbi:hypothetical protein Q73_11500 [Bacillus coahuilensis m2-6]|uniref:Cytosolic protein n=1 Tax=Bacillus coahuilensis p1.1.43 TaxID=1150625 RepID=A0A147K6D0_9BACI|nr:DUF6154 family protein [Bacillus coahuilensis]KUP05440.1 hypothetical protein Q75_12075 [Bacillus coahuilensis p1.1.43]KUP06344.1 hypothetical protein Q73_11500 [Bacillus coahuilensis m2-6]
MKLVDELYEMYKGKLRGTEEDLDMITLTVLEHFDRSELIELIEDMKQEELEYFIRLYIVETLKEKILNEENAEERNSAKHLH